MSQELEDVLNRLDRLESIEAIRQLATVYAVACDEQFVGLVATKDCKYAAASFQALNVPRVVNHPLQDLVHPIQWRQAADHHIGWHS